MKRLRIASLLASGTEMVCGLGLAEQLVAISHECDFPAEALHLPRVTSAKIDALASSRAIDETVREMSHDHAALYAVDDAQLAALRPDVIITQAQCDVCAVRYEDVVNAVALHPELAETRIIALNPHTFGDILRDLEAVAEACDVPAAGKTYLADLQQRVETVRQRGLRLQRKPRVVGIEWMEPIMVAGNWMPEMIDIAGGESPLGTAGTHSPYARWEDIRAAAPDVVLIMPCGFDLPRTISELDVLTNLPGWEQTPAAQTGRVFVVDGNAYFNRSGPRMVDSLEILAAFVQQGEMPAWIPDSAWRIIGA